jgi:hypothetical protein
MLKIWAESGSKVKQGHSQGRCRRRFPDERAVIMNFVKILGIGVLSAATLAATSASANLIVNGGFETGDLSGWNIILEGYPIYIVTSPVESGTYAAQVAGYSFALDELGQNVATAPGQSYVLSFGYYQDPSTPNGFSVSWDGATVYMQTPDTNTGGAYQDVSVVVVGTGSDSVVFTAYNDPAFAYLDDVSLTTSGTPEPAAWAMMLVGSAAMGAVLRRRRRLAIAA